MSKFEKVSKFKNVEFQMPERKTTESAGYDFVVAQDTIIPSMFKMMNRVKKQVDYYMTNEITLKEMEKRTKESGVRPTLISTGLKCKLESGTYLELTVRSSCPLKNWLIMANGVGIIDADYYNNPDNEGEIFFQLINLSPWDIELKKGDRIGQGIIKSYLTTEDDKATGKRTGGFGSTNE